MTLEEFKQSLSLNAPPNNLSILLKALWWDANNHWDQAHKLAQDVHTKDGSLVHAYLHRKEGDDGNAGYWYARAGRNHCHDSLESEWNDLVGEFLERH